MRTLTPLKLVALRRWKGWTQARVAAMLGVTTNTVARWERGEVTMPDWPARVLDRHLRAFDRDGGPRTYPIRTRHGRPR